LHRCTLPFSSNPRGRYTTFLKESSIHNFRAYLREADKQEFAFALEPMQREALSVSEVARVRAVMKPIDAKNGDVSDVRVDLRAWIEVR
jgi:arginine/ornithine N-succinyltransferase beta subunit